MRLTYQGNEKRATNCTGPSENFKVEQFEIEVEDIGKVISHYLGYNYKKLTVAKCHVGERLERISQANGYSCCYITNLKKGE